MTPLVTPPDPRATVTLPIETEIVPEPEVLPIVICQCAECDCTRKDRSLSYATSSWLVCMACCLDRHRYEVGTWCEHCGSRIGSKLVGKTELWR